MGTPGKGRADFLDLGDWNAVCSMCGRKRKASQMVKNWQGMYRCPEHNEARHPQDFVRAVPDVQTPPWVQPPADEFTNFCDLQGVSCLADYAVADCAIADLLPVFAVTEADLVIVTDLDIPIETDLGQGILI